MTENVHTVLFVSAVVLLAREGERPSRAVAFAGGALVGLAALARSVSTVFLGLAALRRAAGPNGIARGPVAASLHPGRRRVGDPSLDGAQRLRDPRARADRVAPRSRTSGTRTTWSTARRFLRQEDEVHSQPTPARQAGARPSPSRCTASPRGRLGFADKVRANFWHFLRPEGLHNLLRIERSLEPWRARGHAAARRPGPAGVRRRCSSPFVLAGRPSPARALILLWCAYYLFMVVVVFHNEIRYRSAFVPFAFAGAAGGARSRCRAANAGASRGSGGRSGRRRAGARHLVAVRRARRPRRASAPGHAAARPPRRGRRVTAGCAPSGRRARPGLAAALAACSAATFAWRDRHGARPRRLPRARRSRDSRQLERAHRAARVSGAELATGGRGRARATLDRCRGTTIPGWCWRSRGATCRRRAPTRSRWATDSTTAPCAASCTRGARNRR